MMINSLYISKLFNEFSYEIDIGKDLTFIHSPNGYGKSTLMHILYSALKGDVGYLSEVPFERMDIGFDDDTSLIIGNCSYRCRRPSWRARLHPRRWHR